MEYQHISVFAIAISCLSFVVSIGAAVISFYTLIENRRVTKWSNNYLRLVEAEKSLRDHPELLAFHGVTDNMLKECDASVDEVVYLLQSFRAGQESWEIDPKGESFLTPYRIQMLNQPKVALIWRKVLFNKLLFRSGFVEMVDAFIKQQESVSASAQQSASGDALKAEFPTLSNVNQPR